MSNQARPVRWWRRAWWRVTARSSAWFDRYLFAGERQDPIGDIDFIAEGDWAILEQNPRGARILVWLAAGSLLALLLWAGLAEVDEVTRGEGKVIPSRQVQVIQSLDGGIVQRILVREGQQVQTGQLLLKIDPTRFVSSLKENQAQYLALKAKAARLEALASGRPFVVPGEVSARAPALLEQERLLYQSRLAELDASLGVARQQLAQRSQEMNEVRARRDQAAQSFALTQQELEATRPLLRSGAVSDVEVLRLERDVARYRGERDAAAAQLPRIQAAIAEAGRKQQEVELAFRNQASSELSETLGKLASLSEGSVALADRVKQSEVRSPVRGTVKQLLVNTVGGVVQPGKEVIEIVPADDALLLEARIQPRDIAFLRPGQAALVKFTAYDFSTYGGLEAKLEHISADTVTDDKGNAFYVVKVRTKSSYLGDAKRPIIPGMVAEVDILTGKKTILSYLLKPVLRAKANALTER
ncbi:HlyD family type I secretion periplasmic adaptor subunit [Chitiniphilus purpureus]|uniref:Membrane fusion protein (MFP) family protein n=1 Tax=Chitiniphilus purpureus TaxID=2981137 RepID=A0ABY6DIQ7_9NEIS|nr:HlyD family type I secretion periplasmic adaptor subunit [Chitiniphilus sp. CD1]UXY14239.1 HlyD family type I secretion periplasmic adaptor subunit [Chitiniphilus sp. CD1]